MDSIKNSVIKNSPELLPSDLAVSTNNGLASRIFSGWRWDRFVPSLSSRVILIIAAATALALLFAYHVKGVRKAKHEKAVLISRGNALILKDQSLSARRRAELANEFLVSFKKTYPNYQLDLADTSIDEGQSDDTVESILTNTILPKVRGALNFLAPAEK